MIANSVNTPCTSAPTMKRRTSSSTNSAAEPSDRITPMNDSHCSGTTEKPVTRSKFSRIRLYSEYFDWPAKRSSCATSISVGFCANV